MYCMVKLLQPQDPTIGAIVLTGSQKVFAAGADIKGMVDADFATLYRAPFPMSKIGEVRKPVIAAVNGETAVLECRVPRPLPGRRVRGGHDVRHHLRRREGKVWPARDKLG